jgi:hypothetical protein
MQGHLNYFAVSGNHPSLWWFCNQVRWLWLRVVHKARAAFPVHPALPANPAWHAIRAQRWRLDQVDRAPGISLRVFKPKESGNSVADDQHNPGYAPALSRGNLLPLRCSAFLHQRTCC